MNLLRFKSKSLIYITDDSVSIKFYQTIFKKLFLNVIYTNSYENIIEEFFENIKESTPIDLVLFDLNENSINLLNAIRAKNTRIPIILISDSIFNISPEKLINLKTSHYFTKKAKVSDLIKEFFNCIEEVERRIFSSYLNILTIVTRVDLEHNYIYVNDMFENTSGYSKEEVLGKSEKILLEKDACTKFYDEACIQLKSGNNWSGIVKNIDKNNKEYYLNTTIFPILDVNNKAREYLSIAFLVNNDLEKISKLKKYIISEKAKNIQSHTEIERVIQEKIEIALEDGSIKQKELATLISELDIELKKTKKEKRAKAVQYSNLEDNLVELKHKEQDYFIKSKVTIRKLAEANRMAGLDKLEKEKKNKAVHDKLEKSQTNVATLQSYVEDYRKKIKNLEEVIKSYEDDLVYLKSK